MDPKLNLPVTWSIYFMRWISFSAILHNERIMGIIYAEYIFLMRPSLFDCIICAEKIVSRKFAWKCGRVKRPLFLDTTYPTNYLWWKEVSWAIQESLMCEQHKGINMIKHLFWTFLSEQSYRVSGSIRSQSFQSLLSILYTDGGQTAKHVFNWKKSCNILGLLVTN